MSRVTCIARCVFVRRRVSKRGRGRGCFVLTPFRLKLDISNILILGAHSLNLIHFAAIEISRIQYVYYFSLHRTQCTTMTALSKFYTAKVKALAERCLTWLLSHHRKGSLYPDEILHSVDFNVQFLFTFSQTESHR